MAKRGNPNIANYGKETRFTRENAVEMANRSNDAQRNAKALQKLLTKDVPLELVSQVFKSGVQKGDPRILEMLLKILGLMPKEQLDLTVNEPRKFEFVLKNSGAIMQTSQIQVTQVFEKNYHNPSPIVVNVGGVRSSKSYSIAQCINAYALEYPGLAIGICRKVASTLTGSVVRPFIKVAREFDAWHDANFNKTERYYTYDQGDGNPSKSTIQFFGLDDIEKIKSTEFNLIWLEEATGFTYEDFSFLQTRLSAPLPGSWKRNQVILSLNPGDARGWIKTQLLPQEGVCLIESTYKDNPFLSQEYIRSILAMKETNPRMYKMLVLNQWGINEGRVFDKWELYDDATAPKNFDQVIYGLDFGWNHATALIECSFRDNEVYLREVIYKNHINNGELISLMDAVGVNKDLTMIADSAEPDRIDEIFAKGYQRIEGIKKIEVVKTINILQNYKIYIHKDSKNLQSEFDEYEWKKNLAGQYLDKLEPDKQHDDGIAAVRYATQYFDENAGTKPFYV